MVGCNQRNFESQWLDSNRCKNPSLKSTRSSLGILFVYALKQTSVECKDSTKLKKVDRDCLHGLSCNKSAGNFLRYGNLNFFIKQKFQSLDCPSMLEPRGLYRIDGKRPEGVIIIPEKCVNSWNRILRLSMPWHAVARIKVLWATRKPLLLIQNHERLTSVKEWLTTYTFFSCWQ